MKKICALTLFTCLLIFSCTSEDIKDSPLQNNQSKSLNENDVKIKLNSDIPSRSIIREISIDFENAVEVTPCEGTELQAAFSQAIDDIFADPYRLDPLGGLWAQLLIDINFVYAIIGDGPQYFGENGQFTNYIKKDVRNLENFWDMHDEISVRGQHNETLNDKDAIVATLTSVWFTLPPDLTAEFIADEMIANNALSSVLPESPFMASDGFAWDLDGFLGNYDKVIVIGDGLVKFVHDAVGTDEKIGWTTILSHEWAHHIQFKYDYIEYWETIFPYEYEEIVINDETGETIVIRLPNPELTRAIELEADYVAAYYMTHKRGATYNMKRIEQYLENSFQIGDCGFTSGGHHGTPNQRMEASNLGNELANGRRQKGKILSAEEVHNAYIAALPGIVAVPE